MLKQMPKISIVVLSYGQERLLQDTLESIFKQEYPNLEVIVVDGGLTNSQVTHKPIRHIKWQQDASKHGQAEAINKGVAQSMGELIAWINAGDWYTDEALWIIARAFLKHPGCGLYVGNGLRYENNQLIPLCPRHVAVSLNMLREGLHHIIQPATFISREAWVKTEGLRTDFHFSTDADLFVRILERYPAVSINEFLVVIRDLNEARTTIERIERLQEWVSFGRQHAGREMAFGAAYHFLESLTYAREESEILKIMGLLRSYVGKLHKLDPVLCALAPLLENNPKCDEIYLLSKQAMDMLCDELNVRWGTRDMFPVYQDPEHKTFVQIPDSTLPKVKRYISSTGQLPKISIIVPSFNQAKFLPKALESIIRQNYPFLEILVYDGGSTDGSVEIIKQYASHLTYWSSEPDRGPAHAINKGLAMATGEVIGWLNSDDMLAEDALWHIAREFMEHPSTDVVFGNALYVDEHDHLFVVDHGYQKTALYYGRLEPYSRVPYYWTYVHSIPQPTVYFRRNLLSKIGNLDPSYHFIFDFEFFWRLRQVSEFKKIERTLAFYRIHTSAKTAQWNKFLVELYRFSRPLWPNAHTKEFRSVLGQFVDYFLNRHLGNYKHMRRLLKPILQIVVFMGWLNPEQFIAYFYGRRHSSRSALTVLPGNIPSSQHVNYRIEIKNRKYTVAVCNFLYPYHPGRSGGEIRDFHILRKLCSLAEVDFFTLTDPVPDGRVDYLRQYVNNVYSPSFLKRCRPDLVMEEALRVELRNRLATWHKPSTVSMEGSAYHKEVMPFFRLNRAYVIRCLNEFLEIKKPDFLFIGPQLNPLILQQPHIPAETRVILSSYDVESVRISRIAKSQAKFKRRQAIISECKRAEAFERETLKYYDGIIAVSELDKNIYISEYGFEPDRILVLENSVDTEYFSFQPRAQTDRPEIVFIGSMGYWPNDEAAQRLVKRIMPLVRQSIPNARLWIVGQNPSPNLLRLSDGKLNIVTGSVPDVRPYLGMATLTCIPLLTGSGTKYKVLEAASAGVPIVCTPLALEGLSLEPDEHVLVGESDEDLAHLIQTLISSPQKCANLAARAAAHVRKYYSWEANLDKLDRWLDSIKGLPKRK